MRWLTRFRRSTSANNTCKLSLQRLEDRATPAAIVTNVTINSLLSTPFDRAQRSRVTDVAVTFDSHVTFVGDDVNAAAAFTLNRVSGGVVTLAAFVNNAGPGTVVTLTFTGGTVDNISLADGRYALHALRSQFTGAGINGTGPGDTIAGDDYEYDQTPTPSPLDPMKIFRLFGDITADGTVAANDFIQFRLALGGTTFGFDFDNDGAVAASDFIQLRLRIGGPGGP